MHLHFTPAMGFPAATYSHLLDLIKARMSEIQRISTLDRPGYGDYPAGLSWHAMVDELLYTIEQSAEEPVVGMGHSFGAVLTLSAAIKKPDLFSKLILFEPPLLGFRQRMFIRVSRIPGFRKFNPLYRNGGKKQRIFTSPEEAKTYYKSKSVFRNFHPSSIDAFMQSALELRGSGCRLAISIKIENKIAIMPQLFPKPLASDMDITVCYGANSNFIPSLDIPAWRLKMKNLSDVVVDGGHLFPLEFPEKTAGLVAGILNGTGAGIQDLDAFQRDMNKDIQIQRQDKKWNGTIAISALPHTVFEYISEPERQLQWNPDIARIHTLKKTDDKIGSTYRVAVANGSMRVSVNSRITGYDTGKYFAVVHESFISRATVEFKLNETEGNTLLAVFADINFTGLGRVMEVILGKAVIRMQFQNMAKSLRMLKAICENQNAGDRNNRPQIWP